MGMFWFRNYKRQLKFYFHVLHLVLHCYIMAKFVIKLMVEIYEGS